MVCPITGCAAIANNATMEKEIRIRVRAYFCYGALANRNVSYINRQISKCSLRISDYFR